MRHRQPRLPSNIGGNWRGMMTMKRHVTSFDLLIHSAFGVGVLLVVFAGFRMGLQYLEAPGATLLNPLNLGSLVVGAALLLVGVALSLRRNVSTPPRY